jgi:hypothetical protein
LKKLANLGKLFSTLCLNENKNRPACPPK